MNATVTADNGQSAPFNPPIGSTVEVIDTVTYENTTEHRIRFNDGWEAWMKDEWLDLEVPG